MKNMLAFALILGGLVAGAAFLLTEQQANYDKSEFLRKLHEIQLATARQVPYTVMVPDDRIKFEEHNVVATHSKAVEAITKEHPKQNEEDHYIKSREEAAKAGTKDKGKVAGYRERYDFLKERFAVLNAGYTAKLTQQKNGFRFDIVDIKPVVIEGRKVLQLDIFVWGPPQGQLTFADMKLEFVREIETEDKRGKKKMTQALAKIEGSGPPAIFHENAHEWIYEWPPGVSPGYYQGLPLLAPDATVFTFTMNFQIRTAAGTAIPVELKWENIPVEPSWRAPENSPEWANVEVQEASAEELEAFGIKVDD